MRQSTKHPNPGHPIPVNPNPEHPIPEHPKPEHPIPEHPNPEHPIPEHPTPEHPIPEHPVPEHPISEKAGVRTMPRGIFRVVPFDFSMGLGVAPTLLGNPKWEKPQHFPLFIGLIRPP